MTERSHETSVDLEVPFHDCDPLGVVWHGHYYKYMELARCRLLAPMGLDGPDLLETGYRLYVIESKCRYAFPLRYRDKAKVIAWVRETEYRLQIAYEIHNLTADRRSARGHTILAATDEAGNLCLQTPDVLLSRLRIEDEGA